MTKYFESLLYTLMSDGLIYFMLWGHLVSDVIEHEDFFFAVGLDNELVLVVAG